MIQPDLLDYSKGLLSRSESETIKAHIAECAECAALLDQEAAFCARLSAVADEAPLNDVWALIRVETKPRRFRSWGYVGSLFTPKRLAAVVAGLAAVLGAVYIAVSPVNDNRQQQNNVVSRPSPVVAVSDEPLAKHTDAMVAAIEDM